MKEIEKGSFPIVIQELKIFNTQKNMIIKSNTFYIKQYQSDTNYSESFYKPISKIIELNE